jgi:fucose permease
VGSIALRRVPERAVMVPGLAMALTAVTILVTPHSEIIVVAAVAIAGFGFGPVFPIGVSRLLTRVTDSRNTGWVFATCASGGAVLPWLTGLVSTRSGSLRTGFAVPLIALALILLMALAENAILHDGAAEKRKA